MVTKKTPPAENPKIVLISGQPSTFPEENIIRLGRRSWHLGLETNSIEAGFASLNNGKCAILIVHDTPEMPASFILRAQIVDPVAIISPTLVACHPAHRGDMLRLQEMGQPILIEEPENPAAFIGSFEWLIRKWSMGSHKRLTQAKALYLQKDFKRFSQLLTALRGEVDVQRMVTPCIAQLLLKNGDFKSVETFLLDALREFPRNIGIMASLMEVYLRAAMPETALKILTAAKKSHGNIPMLFPDQIQAHLLLNQVAECIPLLETLVRENYGGKLAQKFLARCLYAEGDVGRFLTAVDAFGGHEGDFRNAWQKTAVS